MKSREMNRRSGARQVAGFSMIELLVAVLVMGIGVLGITALQMVSLQNNRGALVRAEAVQLAYDMMDRIRANPPSTAYGGVGIGDAPPNAPDCVANNCTSAQIVAYDIASWKCLLGDHNEDGECVNLRDGVQLPDADDQPGLPEGDGSIQVDGAGLITVTVQWTESGQQRQVVIDSQGWL